MNEQVLTYVPIIKSKKEAELFLMFIMKYKDKFYQFRLQLFDYYKINASWDINSAKPFVFRVINLKNGFDTIYYTFHEAITWIYDQRKYINAVILHNKSGWGFGSIYL